MTVKDILDTLASIDERVSVPRFRLYNEDHDLLTDSFYDAQDFAGRDVKSFCPASDGVLDITMRACEKQIYTVHLSRKEDLYIDIKADSKEEAFAIFWRQAYAGEIDLLNPDVYEENVYAQVKED